MLNDKVNTQVRIVCAGAQFQAVTTLTVDDIVKLLDKDGGASRVGYATIPLANPKVKGEFIHVWRQAIIGFDIVDVSEIPAESKIIIPQMKVPSDVIIKE